MTDDDSAPDPAISLEGVTFAYGKKVALRHVTLRVPRGTTTVLLGTNGAGKTTTLRLCMGLLRPKSGSTRVLGLDSARQRDALSARVGFVPDQPDAWGWMTAKDLFRFLAAHHPRWDAARGAGLLEQLRVPADRPFRAMSRGESMKAMLAAALAPAPEVLLLDEPFGGLDPLVHEEVLRGVIGAMGSRPRTVLVSTHDLDVAARIGERVAVLHDGELRRDLSVEALAAAGEGAAGREALRHVLAEAAGEVVR